MADTATKEKTTKAADKGLSVDDRLDRLERALGIGHEAEEAVLVAPEPPEPRLLYAPPTDDELAAEADRQEAASK